MPRLGLWRVIVVGATFAACAPSPHAAIQTTERVTLRRHVQTLRLYGRRGGVPVIVSSGDGGWIHLGPRVAELLAGKGCFVVGFDVKAYLESFTSNTSTLRPANEPLDYEVLAAFAARESDRRPILIGISEGAGLSLLAATDGDTRHAIAGVVALGLPDVSELGWRWRDSLIYLTHGIPDEPTFGTADIINRVSPAPIAVIQSTGDEFVPVSEVQKIVAAAHEPKRLWIVKASNHRFSDNMPDFERCLLQAIAWIAGNQPR
jgi:type IV secretory pathway VirJ component